MAQSVVVADPQLATVRAESSPAVRVTTTGGPRDEFDRQVQVYIDLGYPELLGTTEEDLRDSLASLRDVAAQERGPDHDTQDRPTTDTQDRPTTDHAATAHADAHHTEAGDPSDDDIPFVLVLGRNTPVNHRVPAMRRGTKHGISVIDEEEAATFHPINGLTLPDADAYLLSGVDVGSRFINIPPEQALGDITAEGRTPLTIGEGVAIATLRPDMLRPNRCFSLAGSRTGTNQRVPAIWISQRRPKLGWCWDRNPHTWLGTASAATRRALATPSVPSP